MKLSIKCLILSGAVLSLHPADLIAQTAVNKNSSNKLQIVMQGLLKDSQQLTAGIFYEDFIKIKQAAQNIAEHPNPGQPMMKKIMANLGKEMPVFKGFDMKVHNTAVSIAKAADEKNMPSVVILYHELVDGCQSCHRQFKTKVSQILKQ